MKKSGVAPNLITYNTVINACAKGGYDWMGLLDLFAQMRYEGVQVWLTMTFPLSPPFNSISLSNSTPSALRFSPFDPNCSISHSRVTNLPSSLSLGFPETNSQISSPTTPCSLSARLDTLLTRPLWFSER